MNTYFLKSIFLLVALSAGASPTLALDVVEGTQADRYIMEKVGNQFVRLDRKTGQMSSCEFIDENLVCRMAPDDRVIFENELSKLQNQISDLQKDVPLEKQSDLNEALKSDMPQNKDTVLDDQVGLVMNYSTKVVRRFFAVMKGMRSNLDSQMKENLSDNNKTQLQ